MHLLLKSKTTQEKTINKKKQIEIDKQIEAVSFSTKKYTKAIEKTNLLYEEKEDEYKKIQITFRETEESSLIFLKELLTKANTIFEALSNKLVFPNVFEGYTISNDMDKYNEEFKFSNNVKRIDEEVFCSFQDYNYQNDTNNYESNSYAMNNYRNIINSIAFTSGEGYLNSFDDQMFDYYTKHLSDVKQLKNINKTIDAFINNILLNNTISFELVQSAKEQSSNISFAVSFLEKFYNKYKDRGYRFINLENFNIFGRLLIQMINASDLTQMHSYRIISSIIFISQWSHYDNVFLCSVLGKCSFFRVSTTWKDLIDYRIIYKLQNKIKEMLTNDSDISRNSKGFFGNMFNRNTSIKNEQTHSTVKEYGFDTKIENYNLLKPNQKKQLDDLLEKFIHSTLKEYIEILSNFNYGLSESVQLIIEKAMNYSLPSEKVKLYLLSSNIESNTIRKWGLNENEPNETKLKIKDIVNKNEASIVIKYPGIPSTNQQKQIIIWEMSHFIALKDKFNMLFLNKDSSPYLRRKLYKELLFNNSKEIADKYRLHIWKALLHYRNIALKINYESKVSQAIAIDSNDNVIIELDIARTAFPKDEELNKERAIRILKCLVYLKREIKYYQGMNYIAAFFLRSTDNEEEAFYFLLSLFETTNLGLMFNQDFRMMKVLLLVYEKLLLLKIPSIYYVLRENNISTSCYITPWIVTLFSNVLQNMQEENTISSVLMNIWDDFIINGWKGMMSSMLAIIYYHKDEIELKKEEGLLTFLIRDLARTPCFNEDYYEKWIETKKTINISSQLIKRIEEEIELEHLLEN